MPLKRKAAVPKSNVSTSATKKAKTTPAAIENEPKAAAKKSNASSLKLSDAGIRTSDDVSNIVDGDVVAPSHCSMCGQPDLARTAAQIKPKSGANGVIDFSGHFAWFDPFSDGFASVVPPNEDPTAAQWATIYSYLATKLSSDASHRSSFTLKLGYRGKSVYLRGPSEKPKTMADSVLASHGAEIVGGFVGDVEFTEDDIPRYYSFNIDLSCVHGYEARLAVPPRMGLRGQGLFKMRRIWADPRDPNKELFEGVWDLTVSADSRHTKGRYGMDEDGEGSGALFWAIRHEAGKGEENDNEDESCFY